jgi:hypothetical protein
MSADFTGLTAAVVAGLPEVTACRMVSRDGLPLACQPTAEEDRALERWTRLAAVGDMHRGFVEVGAEMWVFARKGPFGALAIAGAGARAGAILVELEDALTQAESARVRPRREAASAGREPSSPESRRRRLSLHPAARERVPAVRRGRKRPAEEQPEPEIVTAADPRPVSPGVVDPLDLVREFGGLLSIQEDEEG